jgi:hypothetical protein
LGLHGYKPVEVKSWAPALEIETDPYGMREHFANEAMGHVPQLVNAQASDGNPLGQVRAHGFTALAPARADFEHGGTLGRGHSFARGGPDEDALPVRQQGLAKGSATAAVRGPESGQARDPIVQHLNSLGPGRQEGPTGDQPTAGNAQPEREARVGQCLGGPGPVIR